MSITVLPTGGADSRRRICLAVLLLLACAAHAGQAGRPTGATLVIAGGGVARDNEAIYRAFFSAMPDAETGKIAVISAASSGPATAADRVRETFARYGIEEDRILPIHLALIDDPATSGVDESDWAANAHNPVEIEKLAAADAIWMSGGDQSRITALLYDDEGKPSAMLEAIWQSLARGIVVGGSSAGAAVMSSPMIAGGRSLATLLGDRDSEDFLATGRGLGFFDRGLVDQHFGERARLGRLASALCLPGIAPRVGFGIDEDTAMIYRFDSDTIEVAGSGSVTLIDATGARCEQAARPAIHGLLVSVLTPGDSLELASGKYHPATWLKPTIGNEYYDIAPGSHVGMAVPAPRLGRLLSQYLLDNRGATSLDRYSFHMEPESVAGSGVLFRFRQVEGSEGYWGYDSADESQYAIIGVSLDITPVDVAVASPRRAAAP